MDVRPGSNIIVWFSCGVASAVAAKKTIEKYGKTCNVRVINNPVKEEHPDNRRFLKDVQDWLGIEVEDNRNRNYPNASAVEVWDKRKLMSNPKGAPCTVSLKKQAREQWEVGNDFDYYVLGFTADKREVKRYNNFCDNEFIATLPILIEQKLTKRGCFGIIRRAGIKPPQIYEHGFPNANCLGCVKATSPTYWNTLRKEFPEVFEERSEQSRRLGARLVRVNNVRIFLDELDPAATGREMENFSCSLFCGD